MAILFGVDFAENGTTLPAEWTQIRGNVDGLTTGSTRTNPTTSVTVELLTDWASSSSNTAWGPGSALNGFPDITYDQRYNTAVANSARISSSDLAYLDPAKTYTVKVIAHVNVDSLITVNGVSEVIPAAASNTSDWQAPAEFTVTPIDNGTDDPYFDVTSDVNTGGFAVLNAVTVEEAVLTTSLDTIPATAYPGETITLGVTGAGAVPGTGGVTINGVSQTIASWSDTSIDITVVQGDTPYGTGNTVTLTTDGGDTDTGTIELVADTASGFGYVVMSSPNTSDESSVAFGATPTVVTGDQFEWEDFNTLGNLVIDAEGFVSSVDTEGTFRGRFWDATDSTWGAVETFTASLPAVASSRGLKRALKVQSLKRSLRKAI